MKRFGMVLMTFIVLGCSQSHLNWNESDSSQTPTIVDRSKPTLINPVDLQTGTFESACTLKRRFNGTPFNNVKWTVTFAPRGERTISFQYREYELSDTTCASEQSTSSFDGTVLPLDPTSALSYQAAFFKGQITQITQTVKEGNPCADNDIFEPGILYRLSDCIERPNLQYLRFRFNSDGSIEFGGFPSPDLYDASEGVFNLLSKVP